MFLVVNGGFAIFSPLFVLKQGGVEVQRGDVLYWICIIRRPDWVCMRIGAEGHLLQCALC